jgi:hypothetical protein
MCLLRHPLWPNVRLSSLLTYSEKGEMRVTVVPAQHAVAWVEVTRQ